MKEVHDTRTIDIEDAIDQSPLPPTQTIGYIRVSSKDQNTSRQLADVKCDVVFTDKVSGNKKNRPQLQELFRYARKGDTVVIHSLDRLARDIGLLIELVNQFKAKGVSVKFLHENLTFNALSNSPMDELIFHFFGAIAQFQRAVIRETQREGIDNILNDPIKRAKKYKGRKPALSEEQQEKLINILRKKISNLDEYKSLSYAQIAKDFKITYMTLNRYREKFKDQINQQGKSDAEK
ncbi:TPA: recombinase family protein [Acinetobacter baumannii]|nr:recombinase family protein [Acinetobacter baumannii]